MSYLVCYTIRMMIKKENTHWIVEFDNGKQIGPFDSLFEAKMWIARAKFLDERMER